MSSPYVSLAPAPSHGVPREVDSGQTSMPYTCVTCSRRKVKCDKVAPICSTCRKSSLRCVYQAPAPRKKRRRTSDTIHERLEKYERLLKDNGLLPKDSPDQADSDTGTPLDMPNAVPREKPVDGEAGAPRNAPPIREDPHRHGKIIYAAGKQRWVDSILWRSLGEDELDPVSDDGDDADPDHENHQGGSGHAANSDALAIDIDPLSASLLAHGGPSKRLLELHPTYEQAMIMWRTYVDCVEPVVKILHIPSTLHMLQRAASSPGSVSRSTECICFAVYHFAVVAMTDAQCLGTLGESRQKLRARYHNALKQSLVNAHFLRTTEVGVVQAYVLFCLSVRTTYDQQTFWILTGVAVRLGQRIGLHRDGKDLQLQPFDVQMRRRLFWQLLPLDSLAGQLTGTGIALPADSWTTKQPLNVNDEDIWPGMTEEPTERTGATDMIFCLVRSEVGRFHQKAGPRLVGSTMGSWPRLWEVDQGRTIQEMEELIVELENIIETKYLRYCDPIFPVHCLSMAMARGGCAVARFRIRLQRLMGPHLKSKDTHQDIAARKEIMPYALKIMDYAISTKSNPSIMPFKWHMDAFFMWDAVVFVLNDLRRDEPAIDPEVAWTKSDAAFGGNNIFFEQKRALHVAVGKLALKAWNKQLERGQNMSEPNFITSLKATAERRDAARRRHEQPGYLENIAAASMAVPTQTPITPDQTQSTGMTPFLSVDQLDQYFNLNDMDWSSWDQLLTNPDDLPKFPV